MKLRVKFSAWKLQEMKGADFDKTDIELLLKDRSRLWVQNGRKEAVYRKGS